MGGTDGDTEDVGIQLRDRLCLKRLDWVIKEE